MTAYVLYGLLWIVTRNIKIVGHFQRYPCDIVFLPMSIVFGWFHCLFIKTWALFTLNQVRFLLWFPS